MEKKNLINAIAAAGLSVAAAMPVSAETQIGVGIRYHFGDKAPTLGLFVRDVDFRDVNSNSFSSSESYIAGEPLFTETNASAGFDVPELGFKEGDKITYDWYDGSQDRVTNTTTTNTRNSDKISGFGARINFPLSKDWKSPSVELTGIYGNTNTFGQLGVGYDFKRDEITLPASINYSHFEAGTNLRHPVEDAFVGLNSTGSFKKLDERIIENSSTTENLCPNGEANYAVVKEINGQKVNNSACGNW